MASEERLKQLTELLPVFLANYIKRFLERAYDHAFQTELGQKLIGLSSGKKYGLEFILNALTAFFESRLAENTKLAKFAKEVGIDVAPEISKRMINGAKEEISLSAQTLQEKEVVALLLSLEDKDLVELLKWLYEKEEAEKRIFLGQLSSLSINELSRLLRLSSTEREQFLNLFRSEKVGSTKTSFFLEGAREELRKMTQGVKEVRNRIRGRK